MHTSKILGVAMTAVVSLAIAHQAAAQVNSTDVLTRTVKFGDLNVQTEAGAKTLLGRIRVAARFVCAGGAYTDTTLISQSARYRSCLRQAQDGAISQVDSPALQAIYMKTSSVRMASK